MAKLGSIIKGALGLDKAKDEAYEVWHASDWVEQRSAYEEMWEWYSGSELTDTIRGQKRDSVTGELPLVWPLQLNPISKFCRIHRAVLLGVQQEIPVLPVQTLVSRQGLDQSQADEAKRLETFLANLWYANRGPALQFELGLLLQVYGGHVLQVAWQPWSTSLPQRIGIISHQNPGHLYPVVVDPNNRWELLECYIGYMITAKEAASLYGVEVGDKEGLYLEHWTRKEWTITVDGQSIRMQGADGKPFEMSGENPLGVVPVIYVPHERAGAFFGDSLVMGPSPLPGLTKEYNARMADKGDYVRGSVPVPWVKNIQGSLESRDLEQNGAKIGQVIDLGNRAPISGAGDPEMGISEPRGMAESVSSFTDEIWTALLQQADVARVATGDDDVSGGRITGPVTAYRMYPTMQHTQVERVNLAEGILEVGRIALRIALEKQGMYAQLDLESPKLTKEMLQFTLQTSWQPMIFIERSERVEELNLRLQAGGISVETYLHDLGSQDVEEETKRIWADRKKQAELEAMARYAAFQMSPAPGQQQPGQNQQSQQGQQTDQRVQRQPTQARQPTPAKE